MKRLSTILRALLALFLLLPTGCVEPYAPDIVDAPPSLLVVEGFINADGPTTIRLSRTASLSATVTPPPETKARLVIEQQNGGSFALIETAPGTYTSVSLTLPAGALCRLRIATNNGQLYVSDFAPVKITPPINEVRLKSDNDVANVLVSTHDDTHASEYYRWQYNETWEITPIYQPSVEYIKSNDSNGRIRNIAVPYPTLCWGNRQSSRILLSKTTTLSQDRVVDFRVQGIPAGSPELYTRYSILVRLQALTVEEHNYWEQLRKNTEAVGSIFDPQPSQPVGNVRNLDTAGPPALGFVGVHSESVRRLFVDSQELPGNWQRRTGYESCLPPDTVYIVPRGLDPLPSSPADILFAAFAARRFLPITPLNNGGTPIGYLAKEPGCVDCRLRGTAMRPSFW